MSQKTFKFRLYPSKEQKQLLERQLDILCFTYNNLLEQKRGQYKQNKKSLSEYHLNKLIRQITSSKEVHSQSLQNLSARISKSYQIFFAKRKLGIKAGLPRFRKRENYKSICFPQPQKLFRDNKLILPKVGLVEIRQHRKLQGKTKTMTIKKYSSGRWFVCFSQECDNNSYILPKTGRIVGIDLGLNHFIATSDCRFFEHSKPLKKFEYKRKILANNFSHKQKGSQNKSKAGIKLAKLEEKIANIRADYNWKVANFLVNNYDTLCLEDLQIRKMVKSHYLAKAIYDVSWGDFVSKLSYKAESAGRKIVKAFSHSTRA